MRHTRPTFTSRGWFWRIAMVMALFAQVTFVTAVFADARGPGAGPHVEAAGIQLHYAHDDATCAGCTIAALSVVVSHGTSLLPPLPTPHMVVASETPQRVDRPLVPTNDSRAPPRAY